MKIFALLAASLATVCNFQAGQPSLEDFCPHFSTNAAILWQASITHLPKDLRIYKRLPPHPFSATVISNAIVLASLQSRGFPKPSTSDFYINEDMGPDYPGLIPVIFEIIPESGTLSYFLPHPGTNTSGIPVDKVLVQRAWACAIQLGVDPAQVALKDMTSHFNQDESGNDLTNQMSGRGVFLSRRLDGILFFANGDDGFNEGFWIEFGCHSEIRSFSLNWPDLKREKLEQRASPQQIIGCIRRYKTMSPPVGQETHYFERLKSLARAKRLTITKITPYYREGVYGEMPADDEPSKIIEPFAVLEAVADFGTSNTTVRLLAPILASDAVRLLRK